MSSVFDSCRTKSIRTEWQMRRWKQNFRDCRQEKKEEAAVHRKQAIAARRKHGNSLSPWERIKWRPCCKGCKEKREHFRRGCQKREGARRNSENEQEQGRTSQQLVLPPPGRFNEGTPASGMELDLPRVRGAHGEGNGAGSSGAEKERQSLLSISPSRPSMDEDALL